MPNCVCKTTNLEEYFFMENGNVNVNVSVIVNVNVKLLSNILD
ncbi:hypothetical protein NIES267_17120 [Calothrix parasitica NIES-267]|uniref:Uncharacterized protein n=1 Tax=Calothrix parasitica NIES-267 TaxID=1973488 RepID=A0A1Z4LLW6_9CYAN|nr:hypothetical protein NIES267_17120 [Calothrix parasitica NIES-267]